jgi:6,7-dimethyl-8-ribityllumazine synthase
MKKGKPFSSLSFILLPSSFIAMPTFEGDLSAPQGRFAVVAAKFNTEICDALLAGALDGFRRYGVPADRIDVVRVPGSFELPLVAQTLGDSGRYAAVVCLGAVIKGDTDHYEYVCQAATDGVLQAGLSCALPVIFGVLTCQTEEQALARAGGSEGNKGYDAAVTAIEMASLMKKLG